MKGEDGVPILLPGTLGNTKEHKSENSDLNWNFLLHHMTSKTSLSDQSSSSSD